MFISLATPQKKNQYHQQQQPHQDNPHFADETEQSEYPSTDETERAGSENINNNNVKRQEGEGEGEGMVAITSMVGALLRAQQYLLHSTNDGTTSVVLLGASFLEIGHRLHREGISRHLISENFQKGMNVALNSLDSMHRKTIEVDWRSNQQVCNIFEVVLSNKLAKRESKILSLLFATAVSTSVADINTGSTKQVSHIKFLSNIHLCSCVGGDVGSSSHVSGFMIPHTPITVQNTIRNDVRVAIFAAPLQDNVNKAKLKANFNTPNALKQWQKEEELILKETAMRIVEVGANLVLAIGTIHKYILHWLDARGIVAVQSVPKNELLSISEATGAKLIYQPNFMDNTDLGTAQSFETMNMSGQLYSCLSIPEVVTMLIRGPTQYKTQQLTQHCYDALAIIRQTKTQEVNSGLYGSLEVIPGAGIPEMNAISAVTSFKDDGDHLASYIVHAFGEGFEIIPKSLLENAGAPSYYTKLKGLYGQGERNSGIAKDGSLQTVDLDSPAGVFDILAVKKRIWSTAADVASMLLLVDDSIVGNPLQY